MIRKATFFICLWTLFIISAAAQTAPIAENDMFTVPSGIPSTIDILANDSDPDGGSLGILNTNIPVNGVVTTGLFVIYQSNLGYLGLDSFSYVISDIEGLTDSAYVYLNIVTPNIPPIAETDSFMVNAGSSDTLFLTGNDADPDNNNFIIGWQSGSANASISILSDSSILYTTNGSFSGLDSFTYIICDDGIPPFCSDTTSVYVEVIEINNPPIASDDFTLINQNDSIQVDVLFNDEEPDGQLLVLTSVITAPSSGQSAIQNGKLFYKPDNCFYGVDSLEYLVCDDEIPALCDSAWLFIEVNQVIGVETNDDYFAVTTLDSITLNVQANDSLFNLSAGQVISTEIISPASQGTLTILNSDSILYVPNSTLIGTDTIIYQLCDACEFCDTAQVLIEYFPPNNPPIAVDDNILLNEDQDTLISVLVNDIDPFGAGLTLGLYTAPLHGIVSTPGSGQINYQPNGNYFGMDSFSYVICTPTNGLCDTAQVVLTISSVDDAPIAGDDNVNGIEDQVLTVSVLNNDVDIDSYPLTVSIIAPPSSGTANVLSNQVVQYIPNLNFIGTDQLTYIVCDTVSPILCDTAVLDINILGVNDSPFANDDSISTMEDNVLIIFVLLNDFDPDGDNLSGSFVSLPQNGSAIFSNADSIIYNPDLNFNGVDSLSYLVCDDIYPPLCDTATVYIDVLPVNDKPIALDDNEETEQGYNVTIIVQDNDFDIEGQPLNTGIITQSFNGTLNLTNNEVVYQPDPGFVGLDQFSYSVCDNGAPVLCDTAIAYISVTANPSPVARNDTAYTDTSVPVIINVLANDYDLNDTDISYSILGLPSDGTIMNNFDGSFTYTSDLGFLGWDSFTYFVNDDGIPQGEDIATVYIYVDIPNEAPVAVNDTIQLLEGDSISFNPLANDTDLDGDTLSIVSLSTGSLGDISLNADGTILYQGINGNNGTDIIDYEICDYLGACSTASLVIIISPFDSEEIVNQIPNAITPNDDSYNDAFIIPNIELYISDLAVYDRWGIRVFSAMNYQNNWKGTYENSSIKLPSGTYYYTIRLTYPSQSPLIRTGTVQIVY